MEDPPVSNTDTTRSSERPLVPSTCITVQDHRISGIGSNAKHGLTGSDILSTFSPQQEPTSEGENDETEEQRGTEKNSDDNDSALLSQDDSANIDASTTADDFDNVTETTDEANQEETPPPKFQVGQKVLARDDQSGILYESIVRRRQYAPRSLQSIHNELVQKNEANPADPADTAEEAEQNVEEYYCWHYFVHYLKWNVKWDRWVEEQAVMEDTEEARELAKKIKDEITGKYKKGRGGKKHKQRVVDSEGDKNKEGDDVQKKRLREKDDMAGPKKKQKTAVQREREKKLLEQNLSGPRKKIAHADRLPLPFNLEKVLVDEFVIITCKPQPGSRRVLRMLPNLPAKVTIERVLDQYLSCKLEVSQKDEDEGIREKWREMVHGIKLLFDQSLPAHLLYPQEIPQYHVIMKDEKLGSVRKSEVYGCEHLLRLIIKLPALLSESRMEMTNVVDITSKMGDLVRFLQKHHSSFFTQSYREPTTDELRVEERRATKKKGGARPSSEKKRARAED